MQVGSTEMVIIESAGSHWNGNDYSVLFTAKLTKPVSRVQLSEIVGKNIEVEGQLHKIQHVESPSAESLQAGSMIGLVTEPLEKPF
jgi:hypothetical protein